ncbi:hypothetical protein EMPS_09998 [Entomortierella parvispora]|uniref:EF-hand domain-containing protein n=1 Tax=Entomortierella parvispora TaxID=205924 RepID=A0A9P3HJ31_9FUNG|nr:hypothetical protein EMPS_09998 [Entomortierella parvispora]
MLPSGRTNSWSLLALLALIATASAGSGIPGQTETEHSNYGDMGKAKVFAKEHMGDKGKNLSEKEELLMLFSLHDGNKDGYLDGIELRAAFSDYNQGSADSALPLTTMLDMIDHVIAEDDTDNDGKISWEEYLISQKYHEG